MKIYKLYDRNLCTYVKSKSGKMTYTRKAWAIKAAQDFFRGGIIVHEFDCHLVETHETELRNN